MQSRQPSETAISRYFKLNFKIIQDKKKLFRLSYSGVSLNNQTSVGFEYNPASVHQQSLVHDPFRAANIDEEFTELPPLSPPNQSRSGNQSGSKKRKLNSDAASVSIE